MSFFSERPTETGGKVREKEIKEIRTSVSFTSTCDVRSPPPFHVRMSMGVGIGLEEGDSQHPSTFTYGNGKVTPIWDADARKHFISHHQCTIKVQRW